MNGPRWIWIGGWGLPPEWLHGQLYAALPDADHTVVPPTATAVDAIDWNSYDRIGGYSLGAFLLLKNADTVPLPALLLAPFFAFPAEHNLGGRVKSVQVHVLLRRLRSDPLQALGDFYHRARLPLAPPKSLPYDRDDLSWGLSQLLNKAVPPKMPSSWQGIVGDADPLLDAARLAALEPRLLRTADAGHAPAELLKAASWT